MTAFLLGRKIGMTRWFLEDGRNIPATIIEAGPCVVTQVKTTESDGYAAIQVGFGDVKPRRATMPVIGHDAKADSSPLRTHREVRMSDGDVESFELGQRLTVDCFEGVVFVDVIGTSKGKGFQGPMKRHGFRGQQASHGVKRVHRGGGSIGGHATNLGTGPKLKKGKRMAGRMGNEQVTARSLDVVSIDTERNLLIVKGAVPGANGGTLQIRTSSRLNRSKNKKKESAAKAG